MTIEIMLGAALMVSLLALLAIALKARATNTADSSAHRTLLEETRRNYESQIAALQRRIDAQHDEMETRLGFSAMISPLRQRIAEFEEQIRKSYMSENVSRDTLTQTLRTQIAELTRSGAEIGAEARRLSDALSGNTRAQGLWGETLLERVLEDGGMREGVHFTLQTSTLDGTPLRNDDGSALRPDAILLLPGGHRLIVDAKTSMTSYLRYAEAPTDARREMELKRHVNSTRAHIDELNARQYHKFIPGAMEHTLMFVPNEAAFLAALQGDPDLQAYAAKRNVAVVSPAHLISVVQLVVQLWRVEHQNRNAESIAREAGKLYDKFVGFAAELDTVGRSLQASVKAYEKCRASLSEGRGNIVSRAERLRDMGARSTKRLSADLLSAAGEGGSQEEEAE